MVFLYSCTVLFLLNLTTLVSVCPLELVVSVFILIPSPVSANFPNFKPPTDLTIPSVVDPA